MLLIVQGTGFCNLDCSYCYLPGRTIKKRIRLDTVRRLVSSLSATAQAARTLAVVWHAGEPLVLPVPFYEEAFAAFAPLRDAGVDVTHGFQTNGTLIDDNWINFFKSTTPSVGVSIDGPKAIHDGARRYRSGIGSWERCMAGIRKLQSAAVPFHTISVLTNASLRVPDDMFNFFYGAGLHDIAFNIEEIEGENRNSSLRSADSEALYVRFLHNFLRRNAEAGHPLRIREAEVAAAAIVDSGIECNTQVEPGRIVSVDVDGNVSTFSPELLGLRHPAYSDFIIGNVWQQDIADMLAGPITQRLAIDIAAGVEECRRTCEFFYFCKGGAPVNKLCETGSFRSAETMFCRLSVKSTIRVCVDILFQSAIGLSSSEEGAHVRLAAV